MENLTKSLSLVSIEEDKKETGLFKRYYYSLQNKSVKNIAMARYEITDVEAGKTTERSEGSLIPMQGVRPGFFLNRSIFTAAKGGVILTIKAVLFVDGSTEGEAKAVSDLKMERGGVELAFREMIPLLRKALENPESLKSIRGISAFRESLDALKPRVETGPAVKTSYEVGQYHLAGLAFRLERAMINGKEHDDMIQQLTDRLEEMEKYLTSSNSVGK